MTRLCEERDFIDSYRQQWPSAAQHPGPTWTSKLNPDFNETTDRIDFVHYQLRKGLVELVSSQVVQTPSWPSDHRAVLSEFLLHLTKRKSKL